METNKTTSHPADCDVSVQLSECGRQDARAVFGTLERVFAGCDAGAPGPESGSGKEPTVWMATFDTSTRAGEHPQPPRLATEVTALLTGGYHAVDEVEHALAELFDVKSSESVSGDQEKECRLLLASR
ncbi:hypothetical protein [Streptomyces sp. SP18CS02]|uniref:hypothetical protein n=1 Tax=Streptomyces sp. SP18CS02 TaxID=3002531 RepID=UPI002E75C75A|nr:hypothetical protein [Streptomyces sp. SP18CS02]MEE1757482.1 hypothetical protein [Streptomyces sp. SP18CS02]